MRWYDYIACFWFADIIAASLISVNILWLTIGVISYIFYESMRKGENNADSER